MKTASRLRVAPNCAASTNEQKSASVDASRTKVRDPIPHVIEDGLQSSGLPLDGRVKADMEQRFGHRFNDVRIHQDDRAGEAASAAEARAFTAGRDVVFGPGQYSPDTQPGVRLLAHELTHIVQQRRGVQPIQDIAPENDLHERQGEVAGRVSRGESAELSRGRLSRLGGDTQLTSLTTVQFDKEEETTHVRDAVERELSRPLAEQGTPLTYSGTAEIPDSHGVLSSVDANAGCELQSVHLAQAIY